MKEIGYHITHKLINCADLGVPQKRKRVFFFGVRNDIDVKLIFGTEPSINLDIKENHITMGEIAIVTQEKLLQNTYFDILDDLQPGDTNLGDIRLRRDNKNTGFQTVFLKSTEVVNTLRAGANDFIKIEREFRQLSDYELLR